MTSLFEQRPGDTGRASSMQIWAPAFQPLMVYLAPWIEAHNTGLVHGDDVIVHFAVKGSLLSLN